MFNYSCEAMVAQTNSKLGKRLDQLWQDVMDDKKKNIDPVCDGNLSKIYNALKDAFVKKYFARFVKIVAEEVGLNIYKVGFSGIGGWCTIMLFGDGTSYLPTLQIENDISGGYIERIYGKLPKKLSGEQLVELAKQYDKTTGGIDRKLKQALFKSVKAEIRFDLVTGFMIEDFLGKNSGMTPFTPQEITAIILHEIGHTTTMIEHAADGYARISSFDFIVKQVEKANGTDPAFAIELANATAKELEALGVKDDAKKLRDLTTKFQTDMESSGGQLADEGNKAAITHGFVDIVAMSIISSIIVVNQMLYTKQGGVQTYSSMDQMQKLGDLPCNERFITWQERKADEYAQTHGYGVHQVTALQKFTKFFNRIGRSASEMASITMAEKMRKDLGVLDKLRCMVMAPLLAVNEMYHRYPDGITRAQELMRCIIRSMKANSDDKEYIRKAIEDITRILEVIEDDKHGTEDYMRKCLRGYKLFLKYCSLPNIISSLVHGKTFYELNELIQQLDRISGSTIAFFGAKLQNLS